MWKAIPQCRPAIAYTVFQMFGAGFRGSKFIILIPKIIAGFIWRKELKQVCRHKIVNCFKHECGHELFTPIG